MNGAQHKKIEKANKSIRKEQLKNPLFSLLGLTLCLNIIACVYLDEVPSCSSLVKSCPKPSLDSFDLAFVRRAIHSMYGQQMPVSLPGLQKWLNIHYPELKPSLSSLRCGMLRQVPEGNAR